MAKITANGLVNSFKLYCAKLGYDPYIHHCEVGQVSTPMEMPSKDTLILCISTYQTDGQELVYQAAISAFKEPNNGWRWITGGGNFSPDYVWETLYTTIRVLPPVRSTEKRIQLMLEEAKQLPVWGVISLNKPLEDEDCPMDWEAELVDAGGMTLEAARELFKDNQKINPEDDRFCIFFPGMN
jgi:hypothetical protein